MGKKIITIEEAVKTVDGSLDQAEAKFHEKYGRYPSLTDEKDYILLGEFLNFEEECKKPKNEIIDIHEFGHRLLRRHLERQDFFSGENKTQNFDAIMGRLRHGPNREYDYRIAIANQFIQEGVEFPTDFQDFIKHLTEIGGVGGAAYLKKTIKDLDENEKESSKIGAWMVNPCEHTKLFVKNAKNYENLIETWEYLKSPRYEEVKRGIK